MQLVPQWLCDPRYSANLRTLYGILASYADTKTRNTSRGRPWRAEVAAQLGVSPKTLDRVALEGECAGLFRIERRASPGTTRPNDVSIYWLLDAEFWREQWTDPLAPGQSAADAAETMVADRVAAKRRAGITPTGGRPKRSKSPGGSVMGDARGSVMGDAPGASPMTPYVYSPVQNPPPEKEAPPARSAGDARRATAGSSAYGRVSGSAASEEFGAVEKGQTERARPKAWLTQDQATAILAVRSALPQKLTEVMPQGMPPVLTNTILAALAEPRTPEQLRERIGRRWREHGHELTAYTEGIKRPVGLAVALVEPSECQEPMCEDGTLLDTGADCRACPERRANRLADKASGLPQQRPNRTRTPQPARPVCPRCERPYKGQPLHEGQVCVDCADEIATAKADLDDAVAAAMRAMAADPTDSTSPVPT